MNPLVQKLGKAKPDEVLLISGKTWNALMKAIPNLIGKQGETAIQPLAIGDDLMVAFDNPVLFYIVQNGELNAGFLPFNPQPFAPGL